MYRWFWALLRVVGIDARADPLDIDDINPLDIPWLSARWTFTFMGRRLW